MIGVSNRWRRAQWRQQVRDHRYQFVYGVTRVDILRDLAQRLQAARRELVLEAAIRKLDKFHLLMLDDFSYVTKDQAETSVLFELISARYEQRSLLITANQPFGQWDKIFPEPAMTVAAIDRLVHRATIFELNVESYRRRTAIDNKRSRQRAAAAEADTAQTKPLPRRQHRYVTVRSDHGFDQRPATTALSGAPQGTAAAPALPQAARPQLATAALAGCGTHPARPSG